MSEKDNGPRLDKIEIKLSYLEDFLNKIQEEILLQSKIIERLSSQNIALTKKLREIISTYSPEIPNSAPPHY